MNIQLLSLFILFITSSQVLSKEISPKTLKEAESYSAIELQSYTQENYKVDDPAGDYALLKRSELVPMRILKSLTSKEELKEEAIAETVDHSTQDYEIQIVPGTEKKAPPPKDMISELNEYCKRHPDEADLYRQIYNSFGAPDAESMKKMLVAISNIGKQIQGRENPLMREGLNKMFTQVIAEERENGIEPQFGTPHEWSKEFLEKYGRTSPMVISSKLLMSLAVGETNRYMKTDKEADLYKWLLEQNDGSIELSNLFRASYKINDGDIYKTLMTIENVLAHQWRNPNREKLPFIAKLKPITSGHEYDGDKFGSWYHLFGMMLYGYVEGGVKASIIGRIEAIGSYMLTPGENMTQKRWMNKEGGQVGGDLAKTVKNKSYLSFKPDSNNLKVESYINKKEDFRDRINVPVDEQIEASLSPNEDRTFIDIKDVKNRNLKNCSVDMIPDMGMGFDSTKKESENNINIGSSLSTISFFKPGVRRIRGFIKCAGLDETISFESK